MKATIKLFKALVVKDETKAADASLVKRMMEKTLSKGFIFSPEVIANYPENELDAMTKDICVGLSGEQINKSFHKSWGKIATASIDQLVMEQCIHYLTTYGFESMGFFSHDTVYIPNEELEVPDLKEGFTLVVIKGYTQDVIMEKLMKILESGVALKEDTISCVLDLAMWLGFNDNSVSRCKNKEVKAALYEYLGIVPGNPVEFLRYVIYKTTGSTLLIKNPKLILQIKESTLLSPYKMFEKYETQYGLDKLAQIFLRFKPLFLAFRKNTKMKKTINRIRRLAVTCHKPMPEDFLNDVTAKLKKKEIIDISKLNQELERVNTFRKVRLAYALGYRMTGSKSILYKIRNGKGFATDFTPSKGAQLYDIYKTVLDSIKKDVRKNVEGKKVYFPYNVNYALPATEKQFSGMFPTGTYVKVHNDMLFGVYWKNVDHHRIDLDLSLLSITHGKIGWDRSYRTEDRRILFSGDITDAPNGATEMFYVKKQVNEAALLIVNYFNYEQDVPVPIQTFVAQESMERFPKNYMANPNNLIASNDDVIDTKQKILGLLVSSPTESRFYFSQASLGLNITSHENEETQHARNYLVASMDCIIELREVLEDAGAVTTGFTKEEADIDLSYETLEKDSIIKLLY